jgi:hypothetical protein
LKNLRKNLTQFITAKSGDILVLKMKIIKARWRVLKSHEYLGGDNKMKSAHQSTG